MLNAMRFTWGDEGYSKVGRQLSFYCSYYHPLKWREVAFVVQKPDVKKDVYLFPRLLWKVRFNVVALGLEFF